MCVYVCVCVYEKTLKEEGRKRIIDKDRERERKKGKEKEKRKKQRQREIRRILMREKQWSKDSESC